MAWDDATLPAYMEEDEDDHTVCYYDCVDEEDEIFDHNLYDDDGGPLTDGQGNDLIPVDPDREYEESEAEQKYGMGCHIP